MKETWRWFGPHDPISLEQIIQAGAQGVVTSLAHIPTGKPWGLEDVLERKADIERNGLSWSVVESVPVHNDIKTRSGDFLAHIENYKISLRNLGQAGVEVVCYNFMPVVDWTRTNLLYELPNSARALRFEMTDFAAYDVFLLCRENAQQDYSPEVLARAKVRVDEMSQEEQQLLEKNIIAGLPGGEGSYDRAGILQAITTFIELGTQGLRENLFAFLREV
ncbi:MAG: mannonate dehydratase, partial [Halioglobus sp.]